MEDFLGDFEGLEQPVLKRKTIDVKLIVGIVIVSLSILLTTLSTILDMGGLYELKNEAYSLGYLMGGASVIIIVSAIILVLSKKKRGRNLLIYSIISLVLSFSTFSISVKNAAEEKLKEKVAYDKMVSLTKDGLLGNEIAKEDITKSKYGKTAPLVECVQGVYIEYQNLRKEAVNIMDVINDESIFSEETLSDLNKIKEKRALLDKSSKDIEEVGNKINDLRNRLKNDVEELDIKKVIKENFIKGFEASIYESSKITANSLKYTDNIIKSINNMVAYLEENQGAYTFESDKLAFYKENDVNAYNKLFAEYNKAIDENNKNYEDIIKNANEIIKKMEKATQ